MILAAIDDPDIEASLAIGAAGANLGVFGDGSRPVNVSPETDESLKDLASKRHDSDPAVGRQAIDDASALGLPASWLVSNWCQSLADPDPSVRKAAVRALRRFHDMRYPDPTH